MAIPFQLDGGVFQPYLEDAAIVDEAYLLCLSRHPTERERSGLLKLLADSNDGEKRAAVEDLFWSLMTSREFLFQH